MDNRSEEERKRSEAQNRMRQGQDLLYRVTGKAANPGSRVMLDKMTLDTFSSEVQKSTLDQLSTEGWTNTWIVQPGLGDSSQPVALDQAAEIENPAPEEPSLQDPDPIAEVHAAQQNKAQEMYASPPVEPKPTTQYRQEAMQTARSDTSSAGLNVRSSSPQPMNLWPPGAAGQPYRAELTEKPDTTETIKAPSLRVDTPSPAATSPVSVADAPSLIADKPAPVAAAPVQAVAAPAPATTDSSKQAEASRPSRVHVRQPVPIDPSLQGDRAEVPPLRPDKMPVFGDDPGKAPFVAVGEDAASEFEKLINAITTLLSQLTYVAIRAREQIDTLIDRMDADREIGLIEPGDDPWPS